jgi:hypothetical protein
VSGRQRVIIEPDIRIFWNMDRSELTTVFVIDHASSGWAVSIAGRRVGLFQTQQQALSYAESRRVELRVRGERSIVRLRCGSAADPDPDRRTIGTLFVGDIVRVGDRRSEA